MMMAALSSSDTRAILEFLDDAATLFHALSSEDEGDDSEHVDSLLLRVESLLLNLSLLLELFPAEEGDELLRAVRDV